MELMGIVIVFLLFVSPIFISNIYIKRFFLCVSFIISSILFFVYILQAIDDDEGYAAIATIVFLFVAVASALFFYFTNEECKKMDIEKEKRKEEHRLKIEKEKEEKEKADKERDEGLERKYGKLTKAIEYDGIIISDSVRVYQESKTILLNFEPYRFDEILNFAITDTEISTGGTMTATTKTSGTSMLGRSVAGALIAGPAGAIIGGSTAKKETIIEQKSKKVSHVYRINVTVDRLDKPLVCLKYGSNGKIANEVVALLNVIINSNKK